MNPKDRPKLLVKKRGGKVISKSDFISQLEEEVLQKQFSRVPLYDDPYFSEKQRPKNRSSGDDKDSPFNLFGDDDSFANHDSIEDSSNLLQTESNETLGKIVFPQLFGEQTIPEIVESTTNSTEEKQKPLNRRNKTKPAGTFTSSYSSLTTTNRLNRNNNTRSNKRLPLTELISIYDVGKRNNNEGCGEYSASDTELDLLLEQGRKKHDRFYDDPMDEDDLFYSTKAFLSEENLPTLREIDVTFRCIVPLLRHEQRQMKNKVGKIANRLRSKNSKALKVGDDPYFRELSHQLKDVQSNIDEGEVLVNSRCEEMALEVYAKALSCCPPQFAFLLHQILYDMMRIYLEGGLFTVKVNEGRLYLNLELDLCTRILEIEPYNEEIRGCRATVFKELHWMDELLDDLDVLCRMFPEKEKYAKMYDLHSKSKDILYEKKSTMTLYQVLKYDLHPVHFIGGKKGILNIPEVKERMREKYDASRYAGIEEIWRRVEMLKTLFHPNVTPGQEIFLSLSVLDKVLEEKIMEKKVEKFKRVSEAGFILCDRQSKKMYDEDLKKRPEEQRYRTRIGRKVLIDIHLEDRIRFIMKEYWEEIEEEGEGMEERITLFATKIVGNQKFRLSFKSFFLL